MMVSEDDFQYAMENTEVLLAPARRIETFGETRFRFFMVSELMDSASEVRVRDGWLHAERPQIVMPGNFAQALLEGFGEQANRFIERLRERGGQLAFLKYGLQFRKTEVAEESIQSSVEEVVARIRGGIREADAPLTAIIRGVDDAWEVCLLKFSIELIQKSAGGNFGDLKNRGLL